VSPGVVLRQARAADLAALAELEALCSVHPWTPAQIAEELNVDAPGEVLVLEAAPGPDGRSRLYAYCAFRVVLDEAHVMNLAVAPDARRRGLGRRLLAFALGRAARAGARAAFLELRAGNQAALSLYRSLGFRETSVRRSYYSQPVEDALVLVLEGLAVNAAGSGPKS
jgi:ribosomal-protein-alanine N-acetyltransferase